MISNQKLNMKKFVPDKYHAPYKGWGIFDGGELIVDTIRRKKSWCLQDYYDIYFESAASMKRRGAKCVRVKIQMMERK